MEVKIIHDDGSKPMIYIALTQSELIEMLKGREKMEYFPESKWPMCVEIRCVED